MKPVKRIFLSLILMGLCLTGLHAQQSPVSAGGSASGPGGNLSYSVGQVVYTTNIGLSGSVAQGVQQAYEISQINTDPEISLVFTVYPNPTTDYITLKIGNYNGNGLAFQLFDLNGSMLQSSRIYGPETNIRMNYLLSATYLLRVTENDTEVSVFKIVKY